MVSADNEPGSEKDREVSGDQDNPRVAWGPADYAVLMISLAISFFVCGMVVEALLHDQSPSDTGAVERVILGLASIVTLYIGVKLRPRD